MNGVAGGPADLPGRLSGASGIEVLQRHDLPVVVIGDDNEVRWTSDGAERWLRAPSPVFLRAGRLRFDDQHWRGGVAALRARLEETAHRQVLLGDPAGSSWVIIAGWLRQLAGEQVLITTYRMAHPLRRTAHSGLAEQFRLTPAQCAVLDLFAHMLPPREIAESLGLTVHTVRSHFKSIHAKTGVRSSMQLLQLVRAFCDA